MTTLRWHLCTWNDCETEKHKRKRDHLITYHVKRLWAYTVCLKLRELYASAKQKGFEETIKGPCEWSPLITALHTKLCLPLIYMYLKSKLSAQEIYTLMNWLKFDFGLGRFKFLKMSLHAKLNTYARDCSSYYVNINWNSYSYFKGWLTWLVIARLWVHGIFYQITQQPYRM